MINKTIVNYLRTDSIELTETIINELNKHSKIEIIKKFNNECDFYSETPLDKEMIKMINDEIQEQKVYLFYGFYKNHLNTNVNSNEKLNGFIKLVNDDYSDTYKVNKYQFLKNAIIEEIEKEKIL
jgi:hypothetical protein